MRINILVVWLLFTVFFAWSCIPSGPDDVTQLDFIYSNHNPDYNFGQGETFARPQNIVILRDVPPVIGQMPPTVDFVISQNILDAISFNMISRGYRQVSQFNDPDFIILPTLSENGILSFNYDWWFWDWWVPNLGYGLNVQYPNFNPARITAVNQGTILLQLVDMKNAVPNQPLTVNWIAAVNGAITGSQSNNASRAVSGINQAFTQSPFLKK